MVLTLDGLKKMKATTLEDLKKIEAAKIEDMENDIPVKVCIEGAVKTCRCEVSKKRFMRKVMRISKRILEKADTESYIYDCMRCELSVIKLSTGNTMVWVQVANSSMFNFYVTTPKYKSFSSNDLFVICKECFEVIKKAFIDEGFEIKEPSICVASNSYSSERLVYGDFNFVF